ncbi:unnamed protein product, partial [Tetraodon nigroviridis]
YVAVCEPLRYTSIMTPARLHTCCALAWLVAVVSIGVLFAFHVNVDLCGNVIEDVYSSNRGILDLACSPTPISNIYGWCIYHQSLTKALKKQREMNSIQMNHNNPFLLSGLTLTWTLSTSVFLIIAFSYMRILHAGIRRDKTGFTVNMKALQTCATHLVVYVVYRIASLIIIVTVRFPSLTPNVKKFCSILFIVVPPAINPVIYGLINSEFDMSSHEDDDSDEGDDDGDDAVECGQPIVFELVGFSVPPGSGPLLFCVTLFAYLLTLLTNGVVAGVIALDKSLHRPMFIMICHLVACDLLGTTGMLPRLMVHFVTGNKQISHGVAITQALCIHTYGASMQTILAVMAYDRYVAVCEPLRYTTIMTSTRLHICCSLAWLVSLLSISVLFFFHINIQLCGNVIQGVYCSNRGILALACSPSPINNLYASLIIIVTVRFPSLTPNVKKFCSILFIVVPPAINPVIYGLISKELRNSIIKQFRTRTQK